MASKTRELMIASGQLIPASRPSGLRPTMGDDAVKRTRAQMIKDGRIILKAPKSTYPLSFSEVPVWH